MSDLISKQRAIEAIDRFIPADPMMSEYTHGISVGLAIATRCIEKFSQENHDSSQGLVKDLISRQDAKDAIDMALDHIDHVPPWVYDKLLNALNEVPSAEKAQLSGEDATSVCKCPCVYREPCDYCHYDDYRGHGCPAEEGLKDE